MNHDTVLSHSSQELSEKETSPKRSSIDSDSDSTSTELCDEPDRLSDIDSEEQTSTSDCCPIVTQEDEQYPIAKSSSTSDSAPVCTTNDVKDERISDILGTIQESRRLQVKGENIEHSDLNDLSVAKFIDQIRRLSVENDNNTTISDALNVSEKSEIESTDYFLQKSSVEEKSQKYENIDEHEIAFNDAHLKSKYSSLNTEEDKNFEKKLIEENKSLNSSFETEKKNSHISEFDENKIIHCKTDNVIESNINVKESKSENFSIIPENSDMTNCNKIIDEKKYSQQYFNSSKSFCEKIEENIESENVNKETTFLTTPYVIGHVPIAPRDQNQKLNRIDLDLSCRSTVLESTDVSNYSSILLSKDDKYEGKAQTKLNIDIKISPKTPESNISYSSGETMGPDSKPCSLTVSPRSPISLESQMFGIIKSCSSTSSDSKTLILNSLVESDVTRDSPKSDTKKTSYDKSSPSTPFSTDSLKNKSEISPKLVISSSSESCSPSKIKSSDRSFSSDLQSPVSANSIKYTSNYNKRGHDTFSNSPMDLSAASSPFYPIANPNQKTPSPNSTVKQQSSAATDKINISPGQKSIKAKETTKLFGCQLKIDTLPKISQTNLNDTLCSDEYTVAKQYSILYEENLVPSEALQNEEAIEENIRDRSDNRSCKKIEENLENDIDDQFFEKDELSQLPLEKFDKQPGSYRYKDLTRSLGRSYSSLERRFSDLKITTSTMKRSSDILQDLKHLEAKANEASDNMLTKKTSFALEDMKNLEARRQDTFSDSARSFSKTRLNIPNIDIMDDRKTYIIKPKIKIDENSDSILKTISLNRNKDKDDEDDGRESKVGVWTKVKPRNKGNSGRKSSDRALKIIQENSVILHKILTCQAKKRLPDLEEISKEITISPINEEISKIFSPILEKMGLNEHEINEELAKIHLKNLDDISSTNISEFDAKINDELSKLSLIDDTEETENLNVDEIICNDYLNTREALIDRKINEELSKLLANYEVHPPNIDKLERGSSSKETANIFQTNLEDIAKNKFDYESLNHSLEIRSNLGDIRESRIQSESYPQYSESVLPYVTPKYINIMSPKSDIYKEFTKLDEISAEPDISKVLSSTYHDNLSSVRCMQSNLPYTSKLNADTMAECSNTLNETSFNLSPTKCSYDVYKSYEIKQQVSPEIKPTNNYSISSYNRVDIEPTFDYVTENSAISTNAQNLDMRKIITSKESLEFKVKYDETARQVNYELSPNQKENIYTLSMDKSLNYYDDLKNESTSTTKYLSITEKCFEKYENSLPKCSNEIDTSYKGKYNLIPSNEYSYTLNLEQDNSLPVTTSLEPKSDIKSSYSHSNQPVYQFLPKSPLSDRYFTTTLNHYTSIISPSIPDESNKSPNHTEYSENVSLHHNIPSSSTSCYRKLSPSQEQVLTTTTEECIDRIPNPKTHFTPFPIRYTNRKPKELALKLGLYSSKDMDSSQRKS